MPVVLDPLVDFSNHAMEDRASEELWKCQSDERGCWRLVVLTRIVSQTCGQTSVRNRVAKAGQHSPPSPGLGIPGPF